MIDIFGRRKTNFAIWIPRAQSVPPALLIGQLVPGNPPAWGGAQRVPLAADPTLRGLWSLPAANCGLIDGEIYHYWFEVDDSRSSNQPMDRIAVTDPFGGSVDWRIFPPGAPDPNQPAAVSRFSGGQLIACDPSGEVGDVLADAPSATLPPNNKLVIYELPTAWAIARSSNQPERAIATFADVTAMVDPGAGGANFSELTLLAPGQSYLTQLGVNALELLPCADSFYKREWGYDPSHYFAPDAELGYPDGNLSPTPNRDLARLVAACHQQNIRFFIDVVMAFAKEDPYNHADAQNFHVDIPSGAACSDDPDYCTSFRADGTRTTRNGFGSTLWRYATPILTYDPISGTNQSIPPAANLMLAYLSRWMEDFHVDGIRIDSVENVANFQFLTAFKNLARSLWNGRWAAGGLGAGADARFIVVGEELTLPASLFTQGVLDGLWNEDFQTRVRAAILGQNAANEPTFEWTVKKAINCLLTGTFTDGAQAINYVTKHDVEGFRHERLFTMFKSWPPDQVDQVEKRIKLAFVCLLTAVGIPMLLAGEEFADRHDYFDENGNVTQFGGKQIDPVNYTRLTGGDNLSDEDTANLPMRRRIFSYARALIRLRTTEPALAVNDTSFIHQDFDDGKRIMAWQRGGAADLPVVVVANFSDFASAPGFDYVVQNWPATPPGRSWVEVTQARAVPPAWVGRESLFPWEAKVYALR
jgi:pullulanase